MFNCCQVLFVLIEISAIDWQAYNKLFMVVLFLFAIYKEKQFWNGMNNSFVFSIEAWSVLSNFWIVFFFSTESLE